MQFPDYSQQSPEVQELMKQLADRKKERSEAVKKLKACAEEVTKDIGDETVIFSLPRLAPSSPDTPSVGTINGCDSKISEAHEELSCREAARQARIERKRRLAKLKRTTFEAVNDLKTRYFDTQKLRQLLDEDENEEEQTNQ